jgi:NTP pyrophosphatase (non-canonical NTP hydrolase)
MVGEAGEACNAIKKLRRVEEGLANKNDEGRTLDTRDKAVAAIGDELADTLIYLSLLALRLGINLEAATVRKFNAVSDRYGFPEKL